jgi:chemotaxis methyl-accepting protein methylase
VAEYEYRYGREYEYFLTVVQEVVEKYLDCSNPKNGFARIWCSACSTERFLP